jgi:hypothetical protein
MDMYEYEDKVRQLGAEEIGRGLYSKVFAIPYTDKVLKIGDMDEWPAYIEWAAKNGHMGKFAPKVFSLKFHNGFYVAIMERLVATMRDLESNGAKNSTQYRAWESVQSRRDPLATDYADYVNTLIKLHLGKDDLHDGNVMVRKDGSLVVTDPFSGRLSSQPFRIKSGSLL